MKTYTFCAGTITPGFVLSRNERGEHVLALGEYGRGSWLANVPLNINPENRPEVDNNVVRDAFLANVGWDKDFFILSRDRQENSNCRLVRFVTVGEGGEGNGFVQRISGFRSKPLVGGHGRNNGVLPNNGTWADEVWVIHEGELLKVQLAGCGTAFAVRVRDGEPTVEPWVNHEPRQKSAQDRPTNGNGKHQWLTLKGSHVADQPARVWSPGVGEVELAKTELDVELEEMARAAGGRRAGTTTRRPDQMVAA